MELAKWNWVELELTKWNWPHVWSGDSPVSWISHKDEETNVAGVHKHSGKAAAVH